MSIQILPQEGTFASNFGAGIGSGLSQQLPEEIRRYRLSKGLENLGQQQQQQSPYQILSTLASLPGIDPGLMGILAPALQQQIARNEALQGGGLSPQAQGMGGQTAPQFTGRREERPGYLQQPDSQAIENLAQNLLRTQPFNYPSLEAARSQAERVLGREHQADVSYQQRIDLLGNEFEKAIESYLQKDKSLQEGEIGGRVRESLLQRAKDELNTSKEAPRSIGQRYAKEAYEIAKEKQSMRKVYDGWSKLNPPNESDIEGLRKIYGKYEKHKIPSDVFIDDLVSTQRISPAAAAYIANPLDNTRAGKVLHKVKPATGFQGIKATFSNQEQKLAKEIAPLLTDKDLIGSLAYIVQAKGYDGQKFLGELQKYADPDKIDEQQSRDLRERQIPRFRSLDEVWLMDFTGEKRRAAR